MTSLFLDDLDKWSGVAVSRMMMVGWLVELQ